ncbi:hypothetical protein ACFS4T_22495 [Pseudomonas lini]
MANEVVESDRIRRQHGAVILARIFQSQSAGVGEGVCRGVVQHWLASHLDAQRLGVDKILEQFRADVSNLSGSSASKFVALHDDLKFHSDSQILGALSLGRSPAIPKSVDRFSLGQITFFALMRYSRSTGITTSVWKGIALV